MSGPTIVDYRAVERERFEAARRRWQSLRGRAAAFRQQCEAAGHSECAVDVGVAVATDSADLDRECDELQNTLTDAASVLARLQVKDRTAQVMSGMQDALADLERRERAAATARQTQMQERPASVAADYTERVGALLASAEGDTRDFMQLGADILATTDSARARLLYKELAARISEANRAIDLLLERRAEIAELRAHLTDLPDPQPVEAVLNQAAQTVERGRDAEGLLAQARTAITAQLDTVAARADQDFVRQAVAEALTELGYVIEDVDVETAETLVFRQSSGHGVRADVGGGQIGLRTVRLDVATGSSTDRDAEEEFCRRVPGFLGALSRRGVSAGIKEQKLPGLIPPETIKLRRQGRTSPSRADEHTPVVRQRRTTT
ncbi:hypothetical protein ACQ86B_29100 (plasmid) [Mycolicibacterium aichiense]|uniref:hypothetical protein n=1 Tax=Mycolicibacterium aichiense TaxID=1799 RepID=UPI003D6690FC